MTRLNFEASEFSSALEHNEASAKVLPDGVRSATNGHVPPVAGIVDSRGASVGASKAR